MTRVLPISIRAEPSAFARKPGTILTGRNSSAARLSVRVKFISDPLCIRVNLWLIWLIFRSQAIFSPNLHGLQTRRLAPQKSLRNSSESFGRVRHIKVVQIIAQLPLQCTSGRVNRARPFSLGNVLTFGAVALPESDRST